MKSPGFFRSRSGRRFAALSALLICALGLAGFALSWTPDVPLSESVEHGPIALQSRWTWAGQEAVSYELGTIQVPENRSRSQSRQISVAFIRIPGLAAAKGTPPVFMLPGGPGDSYVEAFTAKGKRWVELSGLRRAILRFRAAGEIVLIDQRGNSSTGERLRFSYHPLDLPLDRPATPRIEFAADIRSARAALHQFRSKDLAGYTAEECAADVDALRQALGYRRINLFGLSFGSQWSFAIMRLFPAIVERALLSGVEPLDASIDRPTDVIAAFRRIAEVAERDPAFGVHLPRGSIFGAIDAVYRRLDRAPLTVLAATSEGTSIPIVLGTGDLQKYIKQDTASWPARMLALYRGDFRHWAQSAMAERRGNHDDKAPLIAPLIDANLGVSSAGIALLRRDPAGKYLGQWALGSYLATRDIWPVPDAGNALRTPVVTYVPTLFVHGNWDTSTPIENSQRMIPLFPRSHLLTVNQGTHGAIHQLAEEHPQIMNRVLAFLRGGGFAGLPEQVAVAAPRFVPVD